MKKQAEVLRLQIAYYRLLLAQVLTTAHSRLYLDKIAKLEAELAKVEGEQETQIRLSAFATYP